MEKKIIIRLSMSDNRLAQDEDAALYAKVDTVHEQIVAGRIAEEYPGYEVEITREHRLSTEISIYDERDGEVLQGDHTEDVERIRYIIDSTGDAVMGMTEEELEARLTERREEV